MSGPITLSTIRGGTRTPSFATVWYIEASCSAVIDTPWPIGRLPNVLPDQVSGLGSRPGLSPGSSIPVRLPIPNRVMYWYQASGPSRWAISRVPTLLDFASTPVAV